MRIRGQAGKDSKKIKIHSIKPKNIIYLKYIPINISSYHSHIAVIKENVGIKNVHFYVCVYSVSHLLKLHPVDLKPLIHGHPVSLFLLFLPLYGGDLKFKI